jgi:hypothetical protein
MEYDHLTNEELLRYADGQSGLIKTLCERIEMLMRDVQDLEHPTQLSLFKDDENGNTSN